jgi:DNA-binding NarL/FixJ family response regulator
MYNLAIIEDDYEIGELIKSRVNDTGLVRCTGIYEGPITYIDAKKKDDLILLDISMPELNGLDAIPILRENNPDVLIIMNTINDNPDTIFKAIQAGAIGYIDKQSTSIDYTKVFESVIDGGAFLTPSVAFKVLEYFQKNKLKFKQLTNRENEIAARIKDGKSYNFIADDMGISINTVRMHIKNIYGKLQIKSKYELIKLSNQK